MSKIPDWKFEVFKPLMPLENSSDLSRYMDGFDAGRYGKLMPPRRNLCENDKLLIGVGFEHARDIKHGTSCAQKLLERA